MNQNQMNKYQLEYFSGLVAGLSGALIYYAKSNDLDVNLILQMAADGLDKMAEFGMFSNFKVENVHVIKSMTTEEIAEWVNDILYENSGKATYDIPSPLGGYMAQGVIDTDDIKKVLKDRPDL
jgi:hypothetical protein